MPSSSSITNLPLPPSSPRPRNHPKLSVSSPPSSSTPSHDEFNNNASTPSNPTSDLVYSPLGDQRIPKRFLSGLKCLPIQDSSTPASPNPPTDTANTPLVLSQFKFNKNDEDSVFSESSPQLDPSLRLQTSSMVVGSPAFLSSHKNRLLSLDCTPHRNRLLSMDWSPRDENCGFSPVANLGGRTKPPSPPPNPSQYLATDPRIPSRFLTGSNVRHAHHLMGSSPNVKIPEESGTLQFVEIKKDVPRNNLGEAIEMDKFWFNDVRIPARFIKRKEESSKIHENSINWLENNKPSSNCPNLLFSKNNEEDIKDRVRTKEEVAKLVPKRFLKINQNESIHNQNQRDEMQDKFQRIPLRFLEAGTKTNLRIPRRYLRQGLMVNKNNNQQFNEKEKITENDIFLK